MSGRRVAPVRLVLLSHGPTAATRDARFPADEPLEAGAAARIAAMARPWSGRALAFTSPCRRARETAAALEMQAVDEPALRDADPGRWAGRPLADLAAAEPAALAAWLSDEAAPPGGEPSDAIGRRVAAWLAARLAAGTPAVGVTHAAVIRAAIAVVLGVPLAAGRAIDVAPLASASFSADGRRWRFRSLIPPT